MNSLFFYGTLRHIPLLSAVLGRSLEESEVINVTLKDHEVFAVQDEVFPMIVKGGRGATGLLIETISDEEVERLRFYEGGHDFDLELVCVEVDGVPHEARVFFPASGVERANGPWSLDRWVHDSGDWSVFGAHEELSYFGLKSRETVNEMLPMIRARAMAKVIASGEHCSFSPGGMTTKDVATLSMKRPYGAHFTVEEYDLSYRRYDGSSEDNVRRAVLVATDAVIVLPYDPVRDRVLLVEQFRPGPYVRGDNKPWQLEPIAGRIDGKEAIEDAAHREAMEEAGLTIRVLEKVAKCYPSPGTSTEFYHIFVGLADLPDDITGIGGLDHEAEDIQSFVYQLTTLMEFVDEGRIVNAPLVLAAHWLVRHRKRLSTLT
ncbi:NUDIX domain-containing protein [Pseudopelagicola sp. nBUS_20]|uniref:NUDIX domain-containing protein n=2 Tax=unclassified Pseudopelagicola TaxID=2649563 RepID=UPI003EB779F7